ncbi:MAG: hypothetical protein E7040_01310 [Lentisphaerae bacterium]|nr:hypothetical protein [Lentisphaerota bacterium]
MRFAAPFHIVNGILHDRDYKPFPLKPSCFRLTDDREAAETFLAGCKTDRVNMIRLELTEALLTEPDGNLKQGAALDLFDDFVEECCKNEIYLVFTPITEKIKTPDGKTENAIREDEPIFAERYFDALFRHVNRNSQKMFFEYENLAGIDFLPALDCFTVTRLNTYIHHLGCFIQHFFMNQLLELYFLDHGAIPGELASTIEAYPQLSVVNWFPNPEKVRIPAEIPGIPESAVKAYVREAGMPTYLDCPAAACASKALGCKNVFGNGGQEGFITLEADCPMEFQLRFPCEVKTAKYRPSLRKKTDVEIRKDRVYFTLPESCYGVLEVNYDVPDLPHFTMYILVDPVIPAPEKALWLAPGRHDEVDYTAEKTLAFAPGVHYLPEDRLRPVSGHDIYLAPGAVLKCGLTCEKGENLRIYGSGIFDGTLVRRNPGENWKGRADDSFIHFFEGKNIIWDGPMIFNSPFWNLVPEGTHDMVIRHHKAITWAVNSDGIQPRSCVNLLIENCFFKCSDDSIAIKTRRASGMHSYNITIRNVVTWNDAGSSLEIGHTSQGDLLENVSFENIEIIRACGGLCHIYLIDHSAVRNVKYENIYMEGNTFKVPEINFTISQNFYSTDDTRASIKHVSLKNLHVEEEFCGISLSGFDDEHRIEEVALDGLYIHCGESVKAFTGELPYRKLSFADPVKIG